MEKGRHDGVDNAAKVLTLQNLQGYIYVTLCSNRVVSLTLQMCRVFRLDLIPVWKERVDEICE